MTDITLSAAPPDDPLMQRILAAFDAVPLAADPVDAIDRLEALLLKAPQAEITIVNRFTPGLYIREMRQPAHTVVVSMLHKTHHPYTISGGAALVFEPETGLRFLSAPYTGVTKPGTKRVIYAPTDLVWSIYIPTTKTDVDEILRDMEMHHVNNWVGKTMEEIWQQS